MIKFSTLQSLYISQKFASFLDNCSELLSLKKLHACIFVSGFGNNIVLGSKILNRYAKFGLLAESRSVFCRIINNNLSLWNSILIGYFRADQYDEVLVRYLDLKQQKIGLNGSAITFGLKSCIELGRSEFGRGLHVDAFKVSLNSDCFVGSSLVGLYSKHGELEDAARVFDEITEKDLVSYSSIISAYAQCRSGYAYEAFHIADSMQRQQLSPNRVTLASLLRAAAQVGALEEGRAIHGYAIRKRIGVSDEILQTSLIDMYYKCGNPQMAAFIFSNMDARNAGSWNTMIAGHLHMGKALEAFDLFRQMLHGNVLPDMLTLANAILSCASLNYLLEGKSMHAYIIRRGLQLDLVACTALVELYSKFNITKARLMFGSLGKSDVVLYNVLIAGFLHQQLSWEAVSAFREMVSIGIKPNVGSFLNILSAVSNLKDIKHARSIHGYLLRHEDITLNVEIANQIIYTYGKCGCVDYAKDVFNRIKYRDLVSWTSMMMNYVFHGHSDEAISLFCLMQKENSKVDAITIIGLIQAISQLGCLGSVKEIHCHMYRCFLGIELSVINSLITVYARCGRLDMARYLFEQMTERCLTSWNAMISAYGMHGSCEEVLKLFDRMKSENVGPDEVTLTSILTACSHSGLIEEGLQVFCTMVNEYSIVPSEVHYCCIVDLLSRAGQIKEAYNLVKHMPPTQGSSALPALLSACRLYGDTEMGDIIGKQILKLEPDSSSSYNLVSNLFAEGAKWDEVARVRAMTKERGIKSIPGLSLIELDSQCVKCG